MVFATANPPKNGPKKVNTDTIMIAVPGVIALDAIVVAIISAAS